MKKKVKSQEEKSPFTELCGRWSPVLCGSEEGRYPGVHILPSDSRQHDLGCMFVSGDVEMVSSGSWEDLGSPGPSQGSVRQGREEGLHTGTNQTLWGEKVQTASLHLFLILLLAVPWQTPIHS